MFIKKLFSVKDNLHHAYLIEGDYNEVAPELLSHIKGDIYQNFSETFSIDLSRLIKAAQSEKSADKYFILGANFFGREAANSLLKVFEEPTEGTHFFLITPNPHLLPTTLRSRLQFIPAANNKEIKKAPQAEAEKFLKSSQQTRIKMIGEFIEKFEDMEESNLKSSALELLNAIETHLYKTDKDIKSKTYEFEELAKARDYLADRGSSAKMLLEHLALVFPTIK